MGAGGRADPEYARQARAQSASFDFGPQRICWLTQAVTDWMGDHGTLVRMEARLRRPNLVGDTNTVRGTVARTYRDEDEACYAEVEVENVNQTGDGDCERTGDRETARAGIGSHAKPAFRADRRGRLRHLQLTLKGRACNCDQA